MSLKISNCINSISGTIKTVFIIICISLNLAKNKPNLIVKPHCFLYTYKFKIYKYVTLREDNLNNLCKSAELSLVDVVIVVVGSDVSTLLVDTLEVDTVRFSGVSTHVALTQTEPSLRLKSCIISQFRRCSHHSEAGRVDCRRC